MWSQSAARHCRMRRGRRRSGEVRVRTALDSGEREGSEAECHRVATWPALCPDGTNEIDGLVLIGRTQVKFNCAVAVACGASVDRHGRMQVESLAKRLARDDALRVADVLARVQSVGRDRSQRPADPHEGCRCESAVLRSSRSAEFTECDRGSVSRPLRAGRRGRRIEHRTEGRRTARLW